MNLLDFTIGREFLCDGKRWRCTDIGTRVVVAIQVDRARIMSARSDQETSVREMTGEEAEAIGWFDGPPYGVVERVFDEDDQEGCEPVPAPASTP